MTAARIEPYRHSDACMAAIISNSVTCCEIKSQPGIFVEGIKTRRTHEVSGGVIVDSLYWFWIRIWTGVKNQPFFLVRACFFRVLNISGSLARK